MRENDQPGYAGGPVDSGGWYMIGEPGPEVVYLPVGAQVVPPASVRLPDGPVVRIVIHERIGHLDALRMQLALGAYPPRKPDSRWAETWYERLAGAWDRERAGVATACWAEVCADLDRGVRGMIGTREGA